MELSVPKIWPLGPVCPSPGGIIKFFVRFIFGGFFYLLSQGEEEMSESAPNFNLGSMSDLGCISCLLMGYLLPARNNFFEDILIGGLETFIIENRTLLKRQTDAAPPKTMLTPKMMK